MTLAEAKKHWKIAKDNKLGGYKITAYLGEDPVPVMPAEIDGTDVVAVGNEAFRDNAILTGMILPDTLISVGKGAFRHCVHLEEIELPDNLHELPKQLFAGCTALRRVKLPDTMITMEKSVFESVAEDEFAPMGLETLEISEENGTFSTVDGVLYNKACTKLLLCPIKKTSVTLPQTLTEIPNRAFADMETLKSVVLPQKLKKIGIAAFHHCRALEELVVPESVATIGEEAFCSCRNLTLTICGAKTKLAENATIYSPKLIIRAPEGSIAQNYAQVNNLTFIPME